VLATVKSSTLRRTGLLGSLPNFTCPMARQSGLCLTANHCKERRGVL
jgi:hypothetical protein